MRQALTRPYCLRYTPALATNPTISTQSAKPTHLPALSRAMKAAGRSVTRPAGC